MMDFKSRIDLDDVHGMAVALAKAKTLLTPKLLEDLETLYRTPEGFPYDVDARNRPQGPTIRSCSLIGSRIFEALGEKPKGYAMSLIGYCMQVKNEWHWAMHPHVRSALQRLGWFDQAGSTPEPPPTSPVDELARHELEFEESVAAAMKDTSARRQARLLKAKQFPDFVQRTTLVPVRNPDVVAEVTFRAKGRCELCQQLAPFRRARDGSPYLEVHHRIRLIDGGPDTVANAIATCPNCHRELHYGGPSLH